MTKGTKRVPRSDSDLIQALQDQLGILSHAIQQVKSGDQKFIKTITGVLRILVHSHGTNMPLLVALAEKYSIVPIIRTDGSGGVRERSLSDFLNEVAFASGTENIVITNGELIAKASQQDGGAHEDWTVEKDFDFSKGQGLLIGGVPPLVRKFTGMGACVYEAGEQVLREIKVLGQQ